MTDIPEKVERETILDFLKGETPRSYIADNFPKYCAQVYIARFLSRAELFKQIINVSGSIVECGVGNGSGLLSWYQLSKLLEPHNRRRIIYGFDTFSGFPSVHPKDGDDHQAGDQHYPVLDDIQRSIAMQSQNWIMMQHDQTNWIRPKRFFMTHPWAHIQLIEGDFRETGSAFLKANPHVVISMLYLDFDLYAPTAHALNIFRDRMPKGAIVAFDELDHPDWPGETLALLEGIGIRNLELKRFPWEPTLAYAVMS